MTPDQIVEKCQEIIDNYQGDDETALQAILLVQMLAKFVKENLI